MSGPSHAVIASDAVSVDTSSPLGSGAVGVVYRAKYGNEVVVVKRLKMSSISASAVEEFKQEAAILARLNHPRIVRFMGVIIDKERFSIVLEYLPLGSLYNFYTSRPKLPFTNRLSLVSDVASGIAFLHACTPPILHRDLKSLNILLYVDVSGELHCKITDFGIAVIRQGTLTATSTKSVSSEDLQTQKGTLIWMAPELHNLRALYRPPCDVFSFGIVMSEIFSWVGPYGIPVSELRYEVLHRMLTVEKTVPDIGFDDDVPEPILRLVKECLAMDPFKRPDVSALVNRLTEFGEGLDIAHSSNLGGAAAPRDMLDTLEFKVTETNVSERTSSSNRNGLSSIPSPSIRHPDKASSFHFPPLPPSPPPAPHHPPQPNPIASNFNGLPTLPGILPGTPTSSTGRSYHNPTPVTPGSIMCIPQNQPVASPMPMHPSSAVTNASPSIPSSNWPPGVDLKKPERRIGDNLKGIIVFFVVLALAGTGVGIYLGTRTPEKNDLPGNMASTTSATSALSTIRTRSSYSSTSSTSITSATSTTSTTSNTSVETTGPTSTTAPTSANPPVSRFRPVVFRQNFGMQIQVYVLSKLELEDCAFAFMNYENGILFTTRNQDRSPALCLSGDDLSIS
ncbi:Serine/threonine-protein kinase tnni3k [Dinochytrium kinnereticum]|nr:Serine/threonine-protein kinase tnni3k [Dinochytrium kinnereticum]